MVLGEMRALGRRLAGARDARLGVDDDVAFEQAGGFERPEADERGGRVAARARDQLGRRQAGAIELGQAVDGAGRQRSPSSGSACRGRRRRAGGRRRRGRSRGCRAPAARGAVSAAFASGRARKAALTDGAMRSGGVGEDFAVPDAGQGRQLAGRFHRGRAEGGREADARVPREDPHQFLAGIAGGAHQGDVDLRWSVRRWVSYLCRANYLYTSDNYLPVNRKVADLARLVWYSGERARPWHGHV